MIDKIYLSGDIICDQLKEKLKDADFAIAKAEILVRKIGSSLRFDEREKGYIEYAQARDAIDAYHRIP